MRPRCPNSKLSCSSLTMKVGHFVRKSDGRRVQRYRCPKCGKNTSEAVNSSCYRQKKRNLNLPILRLLCSSVSQRRIALIFGISRLTVERKFNFLANEAALSNEEFRKQFFIKPLSEVFLDEMEDKIHTKCKPAAIALVVTKERKIITHQTSRIRPKNLKLNRLSKKKYPEWTDNSKEGFRLMLKKITPLLKHNVIIRSDEKRMYEKAISKHMPHSCHVRYKSRKAVVAGQGEIKEGGKDPLFELNHTCAMLRANINRLIRRTWCTSKKLEALQKHIELYTFFHNTVLS